MALTSIFINTVGTISDTLLISRVGLQRPSTGELLNAHDPIPAMARIVVRTVPKLTQGFLHCLQVPALVTGTAAAEGS